MLLRRRVGRGNIAKESVTAHIAVPTFFLGASRLEAPSRATRTRQHREQILDVSLQTSLAGIPFGTALRRCRASPNAFSRAKIPIARS